MLKYAVWASLFVFATACSGLTYVTGQQILRQGANDPQIQISEDTASLLASGKTLPATAFTPVIDIAKSLSPYFIIYDDSGNPMGSTGLLDGKIPTVPPGVIAYTKEHGQDRITWQPRPGVRSAIVITHVNTGLGGFVLSGRSLREVEKREDQILFFAVSAWIASSIALSLGFIASSQKHPRR